ncbi:MAG: hypothetical protein PF508_17230 [Spirochaeta sp.]|nr:hypothetical protein [Spirochaeta sp.]
MKEFTLITRFESLLSYRLYPEVWRETYGPGEIITRENLPQIVQSGA